MLKLNIVGNFFGTDGYSLHTRNLANFLANEGVDVRVDTGKFPGWEINVNDVELNMLSKPLDKEAMTLMISSPPSWRFGMADGTKKFAGFCIFEGSEIPLYWINHLLDEKVDKIFVASQNTKNAILNTMKRYIKENDN